MSAPIGLPRLDAPAAPDPREQLHRACRELEGVFTRQLLESMRDTIPDDPLLEETNGMETYTQLLDDHLAGSAGPSSTQGLGEALYRQMVRHLPVEEGEK